MSIIIINAELTNTGEMVLREIETATSRKGAIPVAVSGRKLCCIL